ncbi:MAG: OmpA family protein [Bacteroidales bacterium]|nr:OmpA family protein [Bacteroidales bacterium]
MKIYRFIFLIAFILGFVTILPAQNRHVEAADAAFENLKFQIAADKYKKAYSKTKNRTAKGKISFRMAECYRLTKETRRAEAYYRRAIRLEYDKIDPIVILRYADALRANEDYEQAVEQYKLYSEKVPNDNRGEVGAKAAKKAQEWIEDPTQHQVSEINRINSREDDFAPTFADKFYKTIIFTSARESSTGKSTDDWTGQNFSDLYYAKQDRKGEWSEPAKIDNREVVNTKANEGAPAMNADFSKLYFTRCNTQEDKPSGCQLYVSSRQGQGYGEPQKLELGGDSTTAIGHPAISEDELTLIFASNKRGGQGGRDLWIATREKASESFKRPINMTEKINTKGDEMFPFLRNDSTLYFSSNRHIGMGGLDIFVSKKVDGKWSAPKNLKHPINTSADDFGIIFKPEDEEGFFSSNRRGGRGGDDVYHFIIPPLEFTLKGTIKNERTLQFVPDAKIELVGSDGSNLTAKTDEKGFYNFGKSQLEEDVTYEVTVSKKNYFNEQAKLTTVGLDKNKDFERNFMLQPIPEEPIILPEILYDLAKWNLKPQYQDSLQELITTLDENKKIVVELGSHTDARASDEFNDVLSQKRAESVVDYLIKRGIDPERLVARGYGERVPRTLRKDITRDGYTFKEGTTLTEKYIESLETEEKKEVAHQLNRRTEFRVLRKDYIPKDRNQVIAGKQQIDVKTDPDKNVVNYVLGKRGEFLVNCIINGYNAQFVYDEFDRGFNISLEKGLELLNKGAINKEDFEGDPEEILAEGTIANNAKVIIETLRIGDETLNDVTAYISHRLQVPLAIGKSTLQELGKIKVDEKNQKIIFE